MLEVIADSGCRGRIARETPPAAKEILARPHPQGEKCAEIE